MKDGEKSDYDISAELEGSHRDLARNFRPDVSSGILNQPIIVVHLADRGSDRDEFRRKLDRQRPTGDPHPAARRYGEILSRVSIWRALVV